MISACILDCINDEIKIPKLIVLSVPPFNPVRDRPKSPRTPFNLFMTRLLPVMLYSALFSRAFLPSVWIFQTCRRCLLFLERFSLCKHFAVFKLRSVLRPRISKRLTVSRRKVLDTFFIAIKCLPDALAERIYSSQI